MSDAINGIALRNACGRFATGVTVITTSDGDGSHGMTANAFMSISLDPPLIAISLDNRSKMLARLKASRQYAVNILGENMEHIALHFAGRHNSELDNILVSKNDLPVVANAPVQLIADVINEVAAGDHTLFIGQVRAIHSTENVAPLLFHSGRFNRLGAA